MTTFKNVYVLGGGTFSHVRNHLALAMPAFGTTAKKLAALARNKFLKMNVELVLTKMANSESTIVTNEDVALLTSQITNDLQTKVVFFNFGMCDYSGKIGDVDSSKYSKRLKTYNGGVYRMELSPNDKIVKNIRKNRKDIFLVAFKTTCGATEQEQYLAGLNLLKKNSCNLVLANDTLTRVNMIITPEEAKYHVTTDRDEALSQLVDMTYLRSHLSFTRATVVDGKLVSWESEQVYPTLRQVVNYCIEKNAYKPFNGATVGHFACKISPTEFLTSIRKSNFNDLSKNGLVLVKIEGDDNVIAYGAKPSVGGQSQRIVFTEHPDFDCIVHFHCPIKATSQVPVVSQREYECGSHQCGKNTSNGLKRFNNLSAVMLDNHGPNIVFNHSIDPLEVISFIEENFDLSAKTSGPVKID